MDQTPDPTQAPEENCGCPEGEGKLTLDGSVPVVQITNLQTKFGRTVVHQDLNLEIEQGEILSIVGGSGTGKTVLLRQMLGLERPSKGCVRIFGEDISEANAEHLQQLRNHWGMLFQQGALYSALTGARRALDLLHIVVLLRAEAAAQRQMGHAEDGVHRRADLVAHVGQEIALGPVCLFGMDFTLAGLHQGAHIEGHAIQCHGPAVSIVFSHAAGQQSAPAAIGLPIAGFGIYQAGPGQQGVVGRLADLVDIVGVDVGPHLLQRQAILGNFGNAGQPEAPGVGPDAVVSQRQAPERKPHQATVPEAGARTESPQSGAGRSDSQKRVPSAVATPHHWQPSSWTQPWSSPWACMWSMASTSNSQWVGVHPLACAHLAHALLQSHGTGSPGNSAE
eukprot:gene41676-55263_t